ncbi:hypothetical protein CEE69_08700 [Rhodopirellula bahusiensis]|uniref:Uncharacterized protein n=1 Tax=Rhodopirellula bahusiensis TaxID=2014065 RepID=A0A2G1W9J0_9BACT|nr:hypothetical protein CEE69_08700 [Rhodopirellula bahusiensis]
MDGRCLKESWHGKCISRIPAIEVRFLDLSAQKPGGVKHRKSIQMRKNDEAKVKLLFACKVTKRQR